MNDIFKAGKGNFRCDFQPQPDIGSFIVGVPIYLFVLPLVCLSLLLLLC